MPYTNDMQSLAQIVSPVDAAMQAGQEQGNAAIQDALKTQLMQQTQAANIQKPTLENALLQAQGNNMQGMAMQNQAKGLEDVGTLNSSIGATNAQNTAKMSTAQMEQLSNMGQIVGQLSQYMSQVPPPARPAMMQQFLDSHNVNDPVLRQVVGSGDPDMLNQISQGLFGVSQQARSIQLQEGMKGQTARDVANIQGDSRVTAAETTAQSRVDAANIARQYKEQAMTMEQRAAKAYAAGDMQTYSDLSKMAMQLRQLSAQNTAGIMGLPMDVPMPPQGGPGQGQMPQGNAVEAEMRRRGLLK